LPTVICIRLKRFNTNLCFNSKAIFRVFVLFFVKRHELELLNKFDLVESIDLVEFVKYLLQKEYLISINTESTIGFKILILD
jgi:hypothetical protein